MIWVHPSTAAKGRRAQINFSSVHPSSVRIFFWSHILLSTRGQPIHWLVKYSPPAHHECPQWAKWWDCQWARHISTSWPTPPSQISNNGYTLLETVSGMAHILSAQTLVYFYFMNTFLLPSTLCFLQLANAKVINCCHSGKFAGEKAMEIHKKGVYRKFLHIFPYFWRYFRGQIHLSTHQGEIFYVRYTIHPNMGGKS